MSAAHPEAPLTIDAPRPLLDATEGNARIAVRGTLGRAPFRGAFVLLGTRHRMIVNKALAAASGVYDGARTTLELEREIDPALARLQAAQND